MNPLAIAVVVGTAVPVSFAAGVLFHKYVISEAERIKLAVLASEQRIRTDVQTVLRGAGADVSKLASKL